jgi:hypothetical protein
VEIGSVSSPSFPTPPPSIRGKWFPPQFVGGDDKDTLWLGIWNIDDPQVPPAPGLPDGDSGPVPSWTIFAWIAEDIRDFIPGDSMAVDMWLSSLRIKIEANLHSLYP